MNIYLDLETIPAQDPRVIGELAATIAAPGNYKKADTIAEWEATQKPALVTEAWKLTSFDGAYGQIVCACMAIDDEPPRAYFDVDWRNSERGIIAGLYAAIESRLTVTSRRPVFIGHNIAAFDLRFLYQRSVVLGIPPPGVIPFNGKPWSDFVFDTMTAWAGPRDRVGLDKLCRVFGIAGKGSEIGEAIDGSMVWDFVQRGDIAKVAAYCAGDVERVRQLHKRMTFAAAA